jgi:hypothetical protein
MILSERVAEVYFVVEEACLTAILIYYGFMKPVYLASSFELSIDNPVVNLNYLRNFVK